MARDYRITHQQLKPVVNEAGNGFSQQWNVGYMVTSGPAEGTVGEIHVPTHQLNAETVHGTIQALVAMHQDIAGY